MRKRFFFILGALALGLFALPLTSTAHCGHCGTDDHKTTGTQQSSGQSGTDQGSATQSGSSDSGAASGSDSQQQGSSQQDSSEQGDTQQDDATD